MPARSLDPLAMAALIAAGLLLLFAATGWAYFGTDIFITAILSGLAYCGF